jgi:hypothetical protein
MNPDVQALIQRIDQLERRLARFERLDRYQMEKPLYGGTNGLRIVPSGKLSFFNVVPVEQFDYDFNATMSGTYGAAEQNTLEGIKDALISYGLIHA